MSKYIYRTHCPKGHAYQSTPTRARGRRSCPICLDRQLCQQCRLRPVSRTGHPFCSKACSNASRAVPVAERFLNYFKPGNLDACWPWTGTVDTAGYGVIGDHAQRQLRAHRIAYERANGPIPEGLRVLHRCDNPPCCNPNHLFVGTDADNMADKIAKGRQSSTLTAKDVVAIKKRLRAGEMPTRIARKYGVSPRSIYTIRDGISWKHVS